MVVTKKGSHKYGGLHKKTTDEVYHDYLSASSKFIKKDPFSYTTTKEKTLRKET